MMVPNVYVLVIKIARYFVLRVTHFGLVISCVKQWQLYLVTSCVKKVGVAGSCVFPTEKIKLA